MKDSQVPELLKEALRQRNKRMAAVGQLGLSDAEINSIGLSFLREPGSVATAYKVDATGPELILVAESELGKLIEEHGAPEPD
jgi:hypothetical protein